MVNLQDTPAAGPLTAADLDRVTNTGRIYHLHRATVAQCPPCTQDHRCDQGDKCPARSCAPEGGTFAESVPSGSVLSMRRHHRTRATVGLAIALAVVGYLWQFALPLLG